MHTPLYPSHDLATADLYERRSPEALAFLIEQGRELEFSFRGKAYFLSLFHAEKYVSLWCGDNQQSFDSMAELFARATLDGVPFSAAWQEAQLDYLF